MLAKHHEEIYLESFDGLRLHATWFPAEEETEITKRSSVSRLLQLWNERLCRAVRLLSEKGLFHADRGRTGARKEPGRIYRLRLSGPEGCALLDQLGDRKVRRADADHSSWDFHGSGHSADDHGTYAACSGEGRDLRLRLHFTEGCFQPCAPFHVSSAPLFP